MPRLVSSSVRACVRAAEAEIGGRTALQCSTCTSVRAWRARNMQWVRWVVPSTKLGRNDARPGAGRGGGRSLVWMLPKVFLYLRLGTVFGGLLSSGRDWRGRAGEGGSLARLVQPRLELIRDR